MTMLMVVMLMMLMTAMVMAMAVAMLMMIMMKTAWWQGQHEESGYSCLCCCSSWCCCLASCPLSLRLSLAAGVGHWLCPLLSCPSYSLSSPVHGLRVAACSSGPVAVQWVHTPTATVVFCTTIVERSTFTSLSVYTTHCISSVAFEMALHYVSFYFAANASHHRLKCSCALIARLQRNTSRPDHTPSKLPEADEPRNCTVSLGHHGQANLRDCTGSFGGRSVRRNRWGLFCVEKLFGNWMIRVASGHASEHTDKRQTMIIVLIVVGIVAVAVVCRCCEMMMGRKVIHSVDDGDQVEAKRHDDNCDNGRLRIGSLIRRSSCIPAKPSALLLEQHPRGPTATNAKEGSPHRPAPRKATRCSGMGLVFDKLG